MFRAVVLPKGTPTHTTTPKNFPNYNRLLLSESCFTVGSVCANLMYRVRFLTPHVTFCTKIQKFNFFCKLLSRLPCLRDVLCKLQMRLLIVFFQQWLPSCHFKKKIKASFVKCMANSCLVDRFFHVNYGSLQLLHS